MEILLWLLIAFNAIYLLKLLHEKEQALHFVEKIADKLVPFVNKDLPPQRLATVRNDIKLFLLMNKYGKNELKEFKKRQNKFIQEYNL